MYKTIFRILPLALIGVMMSCGSKKNEEIVAPQGMHTLNLNRYGKPFAIFVPDTVAAKLTVTEQSNGALDIRVGKNFAISINEQAADINMKKQDLKDDEVNKLKNMITDEPTAIMWESQVVEPEFHFLVNQKIGESDYSFEDIKDTEANPFGKEAIQKMFDSAKNIKEVRKEPKS
ncbi:MAG: hypothetical protein JNL60_17775 [Bacteroidia bacterium]|nr:hypothetical protein [Bacteroidia bacterium]